MNNLYNEFSDYIETLEAAGRLLLYRDEAELSFLKDWLEEEPATIAEIPEAEEEKQNEPSAALVENCKLCGSVISKKPGWGTGRNGIMIVMNTPLNISRIEIENLKNQSTDMLQKMIAAINVDLKDCYITNLIKCEPDSHSSTPGMMLKNCSSILIKEIEEKNPKVIIVMGETLPLKKIINQETSRKWFGIDHPINMIRKAELKKNAWATLQKVMQELK